MIIKIKHVFIFCCFFLFADIIANAQTFDTILYYQVSFDINKVKIALNDVKYRNNSTGGYKPAQKAVNKVWLESDVLCLKCVKDEGVAANIQAKLQQCTFVKQSQPKDSVEEIQKPTPKKITIDDFLNSNDTIVFTSGFILFNLKDIHPRSRKYYHLIELIHQLHLKIGEYECVPYVQRQKTKQLLDEMNDIVIEIADDYTVEKDQFLSPIQQEYYLKLYNKFNQRWEEEYGSESEE